MRSPAGRSNQNQTAVSLSDPLSHRYGGIAESLKRCPLEKASVDGGESLAKGNRFDINIKNSFFNVSPQGELKPRSRSVPPSRLRETAESSGAYCVSTEALKTQPPMVPLSSLHLDDDDGISTPFENLSTCRELDGSSMAEVEERLQPFPDNDTAHELRKQLARHQLLQAVSKVAPQRVFPEPRKGGISIGVGGLVGFRPPVSLFTSQQFQESTGAHDAPKAFPVQHKLMLLENNASPFQHKLKPLKNHSLCSAQKLCRLFAPDSVSGKQKQVVGFGDQTFNLANIGHWVDRDECVGFLVGKCETVVIRQIQAGLEVVCGIIRSSWLAQLYRERGMGHVVENFIKDQLPDLLNISCLLLTTGRSMIASVNLGFQTPDNLTLSYVNDSHAFVTCHNALVALLLAIALRGMVVCPKSLKADKECSVWHAGNQSLEENLLYLRTDQKASQNQIALPELCRAVLVQEQGVQVVNDEIIKPNTTVQFAGFSYNHDIDNIWELLVTRGWAHLMDYFSLPPNTSGKGSGKNQGYAFGNFKRSEHAVRFMRAWTTGKISRGSRALTANWATKRQGLYMNLLHHQWQAMMSAPGSDAWFFVDEEWQRTNDVAPPKQAGGRVSCHNLGMIRKSLMEIAQIETLNSEKLDVEAWQKLQNKIVFTAQLDAWMNHLSK